MSTQSGVGNLALTVTIEEIDHTTASAFAEQVAEGLRRFQEDAPSGSALTVDLSEVAFLDSSGIRVLIDADQAARGLGGRVVVVGARGLVERCLRVTGVLDHLSPADDAGT